MKAQLIALSGALLLGACASGNGTAAIQALPSSLAAGARVASVNVSNVPQTGVSADFESVFESSVQNKLNACAQGSEPLTLDVSLDGFDRANPTMTWLLADQNAIAGTARLKNAAGAVVGEYRIRRTFTASGLIGVAMMSQAEDQMSQAFGDELCKQAFPSKRR